MGNKCKKTEYVVTFFSHYYALSFKKKIGNECYIAPVPRSLSSSCGSAVFLPSWKDEYITDGVECVYKLFDGGYEKVYG